MYYYKVIKTPEHIDNETFLRLLSEVSEQRRKKVLRYKFETGRIESLYAYLLLKDLLRKHYGITGNPVFEEGEHGKPHIVSLENENGNVDKNENSVTTTGNNASRNVFPYFNFSHCKTGIACAVSDEPIGIDVERIGRNIDESLIRYVFNDEEAEHVLASEKKSVEFTRLWTIKEALVKLTGTGIADEKQLKNLLTDTARYDFLTEVNENEAWVMTVAYEK